MLIVLTIYAAKSLSPSPPVASVTVIGSRQTGDLSRDLSQWFSQLEAPQTFPCASEKGSSSLLELVLDISPSLNSATLHRQTQLVEDTTDAFELFSAVATPFSYSRRRAQRSGNGIDPEESAFPHPALFRMFTHPSMFSLRPVDFPF